MISCNIRSTRSKFNINKIFGPLKCPVYVKHLWIELACQVFADKISLSVMCWFYSVKVRTIFTIRSAIPSSQKDFLPILRQSMTIYKFQCQCDADYKGRTTRCLEARISPSVPGCIRKQPKALTSRCSQLHNSVIYKHWCDHYIYQMGYLNECFSALHKVMNRKHLVILVEVLAIIELHQSLCKQKKFTYPLKLFMKFGE